ncbi:MAG: hypothetical protein ABR964_08210 [Tepidisphaeraceae bacterium]|jgi:DNA-binding NarL/FixJ family response regulator
MLASWVIDELVKEFSDGEKTPTFVAIGLPNLRDRGGRVQIIHCQTAQAALELLEVLQVDLLLVGGDLLDMSIPQLAAELRRRWPWQRWVLVDDQIADSQERAVRQLAVTGVFCCAGAGRAR